MVFVQVDRGPGKSRTPINASSPTHLRLMDQKSFLRHTRFITGREAIASADLKPEELP
jgi:hypothetical protein